MSAIRTKFNQPSTVELKSKIPEEQKGEQRKELLELRQMLEQLQKKGVEASLPYVDSAGQSTESVSSPEEPGKPMDRQRSLPPTVALQPGSATSAAGLDADKKETETGLNTIEPPGPGESSDSANTGIVNGSESKSSEPPIDIGSKIEDVPSLNSTLLSFVALLTEIPVTQPIPVATSRIHADLKSGETQLPNVRQIGRLRTLPSNQVLKISARQFSPRYWAPAHQIQLL